MSAEPRAVVCGGHGVSDGVSGGSWEIGRGNVAGERTHRVSETGETLLVRVWSSRVLPGLGLPAGANHDPEVRGGRGLGGGELQKLTLPRVYEPHTGATDRGGVHHVYAFTPPPRPAVQVLV